MKNILNLSFFIFAALVLAHEPHLRPADCNRFLRSETRLSMNLWLL